jgi:hypothetical protein
MHNYRTFMSWINPLWLNRGLLSSAVASEMARQTLARLSLNVITDKLKVPELEPAYAGPSSRSHDRVDYRKYLRIEII